MLFDSCRDKRKFVFEVCSMFGSQLSAEELDYWSVYNIIYYCKFNNLNIKGATFEDVISIVEEHERERKMKLHESKQKLVSK